MKYGVAFAVNEDTDYFKPEMLRYDVDKAAFNLGKKLIEEACKKEVTYFYKHVFGEVVPMTEKTNNPMYEYMHTEYRFELETR